MDVTVAPNLNIPMLSVSQASIAETNWKFVNQLLKVDFFIRNLEGMKVFHVLKSIISSSN